ncbi:SDR family NAD(P)-dependent oxidoreductase [Runella sp.]|uniref:SDR family NAD(P)-dependent oxidoreductase n=1 Tax=Runella sp. TaxID=1960881 RepID=UPI003D0BBCAB
MQKIVITGATSGIGRALALEFSKRGYAVGIAGRRTERLIEIQQQLPHCVYETIDVTDANAGLEGLKRLVKKLGGMDALIINAGVGTLDPDFEETDTIISVNVRAFAHQSQWALAYFKENRLAGRIVGISSVATHIATAGSELYSASKAFVTRYWQGLRQAAALTGLGISVTEIRPGYVKSEMTAGQKGMFWLSPTEKAAQQIANATERRARVAYITKRWRLIGALLSILPDALVDMLILNSLRGPAPTKSTS